MCALLVLAQILHPIISLHQLPPIHAFFLPLNVSSNRPFDPIDDHKVDKSLVLTSVFSFFVEDAAPGCARSDIFCEKIFYHIVRIEIEAPLRYGLFCAVSNQMRCCIFGRIYHIEKTKKLCK